MQNKPNVKYAQINVNSYMKSKYEKLDTWLSGKNKPNSNPIKPNFQKAKMNVNSYVIKDYRKKDDFLVRINKANLQNDKNERKLNFNKGLHKKRLFSIPKNKPNSNPIKPNLKKAKMNVNLYVIEDYRKKDDFVVRINKPNLQNAQNERKLNFNKGLQKKRLFSSPKNKPNSNPILSAVGGLQMNLKSLAGKSGHTRRSPIGAIILTFESDMHILKWFLQGEVK